MLSKTEICNLALLMLGQEPISDIDDTSDPTSVKMKAIFDLRLKDLLSRDWNFNRERVQLTRLSATPTFGSWDYKYAKPSDMLNPIALIDENSDEVRYPFQPEGEYILANVTEAYFLYNKNITETGQTRGWFCYLLACDLAYRLAPEFIGKDQYITLRAKRELTEAWQDALSANGRESYYESPDGHSNGNTDVFIGLRDDLL